MKTKYNLIQSSRFTRWFKKLAANHRLNVSERLRDIKSGDFGDHHQTDGKLWELRFMSGESAGLRIYYTIRNNQLVLLAAGGNKSSQKEDIAAAKKIIKQWKNP